KNVFFPRVVNLTKSCSRNSTFRDESINSVLTSYSHMQNNSLDQRKTAYLLIADQKV
ncbi:unnamed protein product, partial [Rotaria sordida]